MHGHYIPNSRSCYNVFFCRFWQTGLPFTEEEKTLTGLKEYAADEASLGDSAIDDLDGSNGGFSLEESLIAHHTVDGLESAHQTEVSEHMSRRGVQAVHSARYGSSGTYGDGGEGTEVVETITQRTVQGVHSAGRGGGLYGADVSVSSSGFEEIDQFGNGHGMGMAQQSMVTETITSSRSGRLQSGLSSTVGGESGSFGSGAYSSGSGMVQSGLVSQFGMASTGEMEEVEEGIESMSMGSFGMGTDMTTAAQATVGHEPGEFGFATETKTAETDQISSYEVEEQKTFFIRAVVDPRTEQPISLQQAILNGIINPTTGSYVNPDTEEKMPIPEAMSKNLIEVSFASTKRGQEKRSTIGMITVKTVREHPRPYTVVSVTDTKTDRKLSQSEAVNNGVINEQRGTYRCVTSNTILLFQFD